MTLLILTLFVDLVPGSDSSMADNDMNPLLSLQDFTVVQIPLWPIMTRKGGSKVGYKIEVQIPLWPIMTATPLSLSKLRNRFRFLYGR